jgi:hypothetical protein
MVGVDLHCDSCLIMYSMALRVYVEMDCVTYLETESNRPMIALLIHVKSAFTKALAT